MLTLLSPNFVPMVVTTDDMIIASLAWGFTFGFGFLTTWSAMKQTKSVWNRHGKRTFKFAYLWMIWLEIIVSLIVSCICWLHLYGVIPPCFAFYFCICTCWALQIQFLLQIIINRATVLLNSRRKSFWLKTSVAIMITAINISVYCIWIPARLQVSEQFAVINKVWDRVEKVLYLLIDGWLNWYFMRVVKKQLMGIGLKKYEPLLRFNMWIIGFSLSMDVLIICMMSLSNTFVYLQFHPLAYIVKLNIELSMASLIAKVSKNESSDGTFGNQLVQISTGASDSHGSNSLALGYTSKETSEGRVSFSRRGSVREMAGINIGEREINDLGRGEINEPVMLTKPQAHLVCTRISLGEYKSDDGESARSRGRDSGEWPLHKTAKEISFLSDNRNGDTMDI